MKSSTKHKFSLSLGLSTLLGFVPVAAYAVDLPSSAQTGQVQQQLSGKPLVPEVMRGAALAVPAPTRAGLSAKAQQIKFVLKRVDLVGAHVFSNDVLLAPYRHLIGHVVTLGDVQHMVDGITAYYRNRGYILSEAVLPAQVIKNGVVRIVVLEGFVDKVSVLNNTKGAGPLLQVYADKIRCERPLTKTTLERYLLLANDLPGVHARAVLTPSKTVSGAADLSLVTDVRQVDGYVSYDNFGTRYLGPQEFHVGGSVNNLMRAGERTNVQGIVTSRTNQLQFIAINHDEQLDSEGTKLSVGANHLETQPGFTVEDLNIRGRADEVYAEVSHPFIRARDRNLTLSGGMHYLNNKTDANVGGNIPISDDRTRWLVVGGSYDFEDFLGTNLIRADLAQGVDVLGAQASPASRPDGKTDFTKVEFQASRVQQIYHPISLFVAAVGQYGFNSLLSAQQFSFGGNQIGRGYDRGEILGDKGLGGTAELRWDTYPNAPILNVMQLYAFYDLGAVWNRNTTVQPGKESAASAGVGTRLGFNKYLSGDFFIAQPLTRKVATEATFDDGHKPRVFFSVMAQA